MNKAKIILSVVAVLAIVGGVFASKAKVAHVFFIPGDVPTVCDVPITGYTTTNSGTLTIYATTDPTLACKTLKYRTILN